MRKIRSIIFILFVDILLSHFLPHETPNRFIWQIAIQDIAVLISINILFKNRVGKSILSSYFGLVIGFFIAALFSLFSYAILYLTVDPVYLDNYLTSRLFLSSLIFSIFAGTFEEFIFRFPLIVVLNYKIRSTRFPVAIIIFQAILFGLLHYNRYRPVIFCVSAFALGLLLGFVSVRLKSLWFVIGLHAGLDSISGIINGVRIGKIISYPGVLSFDDAGNSIKMTTSILFPAVGLLIYFWHKNSSISQTGVSFEKHSSNNEIKPNFLD